MKYGCVFQLTIDEDSDRVMLDDQTLHCGDSLTVLVFNGLTNKTEWVETSLEMNSFGEWYLTGLSGYQVNGLFAFFN